MFLSTVLLVSSLLNSCQSLCPTIVLPKNARCWGQCQSRRSGAKCCCRCLPGYSLMGSESRVCMSEVWSGKQTKCIKNDQKVCPAIRLLQNGLVSNSCGHSFLIGCVLSLTCNDGFQLNGNQVMVCLKSGKWSAFKPKCLPNQKSCPTILQMENGLVSNTCGNGSIIGCALNFKCNDGFQLDGNPVIVCLTSGKWSDPKPKCKGKAARCNQLSSSSKGYWLSKDNTEECNGDPGQTCRLICIRPSILVRPTFVYCDTKALEWSKPIPKCVRPLS